MRSRDGFVLELASVALIVTGLVACTQQAARPPKAASPAQTDSSFAQKSFADIQLTQGELRIFRHTAGDEVLRLQVKIADDAQARGIGLMGVRILPPSAGMVFLFERPVETSFYMKNTLIPLDIAFWGEDRKIHQIMQMSPCEDDPCPHYRPKLRFSGAVEVNGGLLRQKGVRAGDVIKVVSKAPAEEA